jgi:hypothetical protein
MTVYIAWPSAMGGGHLASHGGARCTEVSDQSFPPERVVTTSFLYTNLLQNLTCVEDLFAMQGEKRIAGGYFLA